MKQLDIAMSPPVNIKSLYLTLTHVIFDLGPSGLWPWPLIMNTLSLILVVKWYLKKDLKAIVQDGAPMLRPSGPT